MYKRKGRALKMNSQTKKSGFTIIEVVLVLAIAGLIFLIVFLAVPALQRSQRDQARRSDMGRLVAATQDYRGNHQGQLPTLSGATGTAFLGQVARDSSFEDPSGGTYTLSSALSFASDDSDLTYKTGKIIYQIGKKCASNGNPSAAGGARNVAYAIALESGDIYCQSN